MLRLSPTLLAGGLFTGAVSAHAQPQSLPPDAEAPSALALAAQTSGRLALAVWVEQSPALDGNVLDDQAWATVEPVNGFRQSSPDEGQPATERTEVRVLFTDDAIYFGVVCYDQDPSAIIMSDSRRDSSMNDADSFQMVLDTFSDRQNGFVFGTTPAGQEYGGKSPTRAVSGVCLAAADSRGGAGEGSTSTGTGPGRCAPRSPLSVGAPSSRSRSAPSDIRIARCRCEA